MTETASPAIRLFLQKLADGWRRCAASGRSVMVGVSGGADSVALLRGLVALGSKLAVHVTVAHFNHGWRGEASDADAAWVENLSNELGCRFVMERRPHGSAPVDSAREESARNERYRFFHQAASSYAVDCIAVAHTADDQAETVLHHVLRGSGWAGAAGMKPKRPIDRGSPIPLVRPLLEIRRGEVEAYLRELNQPHRTDATNASLDQTRNRLRHLAMPALEQAMGRDVVVALGRFARHARDMDDLLTRLAHELTPRLIPRESRHGVEIDAVIAGESPSPVLIEVLRGFWRRAGWPERDVTSARWRDLAKWMQGPADVAYGNMLPGAVTCERIGRTIRLSRSSPAEGE